jgi:signal transduction histidine kinase
MSAQARPPRRRLIASLSVLALACCLGAGVLAWLRSPQRGLPYRDVFGSGKADEWQAFGGTWELVNGAMRNESDERGAKLVTGSSYWRNYSIEADVYLLGASGDAGLLIRSSNEEQGVNAYSGYYAGVRTIDNSLVLGRADHGWLEVTQHYPAAGGIRPFQWYHLKIVAVDCEIAASVGVLSDPGQTAIGFTDHQCIPAGRVGLRSYSSGGIWRNVVVRAATHQDLLETLQKGASHGALMARNTTTPGVDSPEVQQWLEREMEQETRAEQSLAGVSTQSIGSLRLSSWAKPAVATVRGVVVLTAPRLYVQDTSGGVYVSQYTGPLLKVGDEVEVTGQVHPEDFSAVMDHATAQVLWARSPMPPLSVTASQASTGRYDATFIELRGVLAARERGPNNSLVLDLDDGPQSFRAVLNPGRSDALVAALKVNSLLRLRGICVVDPALTRNLTPFVLLLPSNEDLDVIAGPPWWSTAHIIALIVATALLAMISVILYHRIENWRLRAILEERGRLAHEMHDTLAQSFAGIGFQLQAISNGVPQHMPELHEQLDLARDLVRHSHEEARRSIATLRAESLESQDLAVALEQCARRMVGGTAVEVTAETNGDPRPIPLRTTDTLFRIGQEAVANAIRHANPARLMIRVAWSENHVCLQIEDDGSGFEPAGPLAGFGLRGMRRRAQTISAVLGVDSRPGAGTSVRVEAPLPPRVTPALWPRILWKLAREQWNHARAARTASSHLYRG